jgi:2-C-methyl-D-erythritol 2,4-cyclodiphosphate synthase
MTDEVRAGIGFDAHPLKEGRKLILGGVEIPFEKGLDGWSDADVLTHAVIDALLGALALGDIGSHFPPGDGQYKGISSLTLLEKVMSLKKEKGWRINNIDATIIAERPKLRDYIDDIRKSLSSVLKIEVERISAKASTANTLGFIGREEGMAAIATATLASVRP